MYLLFNLRRPGLGNFTHPSIFIFLPFFLFLFFSFCFFFFPFFIFLLLLNIHQQPWTGLNYDFLHLIKVRPLSSFSFILLNIFVQTGKNRFSIQLEKVTYLQSLTIVGAEAWRSWDNISTVKSSGYIDDIFIYLSDPSPSIPPPIHPSLTVVQNATDDVLYYRDIKLKQMDEEEWFK